jgi:DNA-binding MarR family transcriptional regulator
MTGEKREDLGALFSRITRRLVTAERPILEGLGLTMWQYIALSRLARRPAATQLELAEAIGYDKTRLIALLDELERQGLITRTPDLADRRARVVELTDKGHQRRLAATAEIRAMEATVLNDFTAAEQRTLVRVLERLAQPD